MCRDYGIPHSQFLSWSQDDRDKAVWMHLRDRDRCRQCGTRRAEWDESQGGHRHAYVADLARCPGCEQIQQRASALDGERARGEDPGRGVRIVLKPNPHARKGGVTGGPQP